MADTSALFLTPRQVAELLGTSDDRIVDLIHADQIVAIDIRSPGSRRATWRISREALDNFLASRMSTPRSTTAARRRRRQDSQVIAFY